MRWRVVVSISEKVGRFFDQRARKFHRIYENTPIIEKTLDRVLRRAIYARTQVLVDEIRRLPSPSLLDVGSGTGVNTFAALKAGASRAVGVDLAKTMVEMARQGAIEQGLEVSVRRGRFHDRWRRTAFRRGRSAWCVRLREGRRGVLPQDVSCGQPYGGCFFSRPRFQGSDPARSLRTPRLSLSSSSTRKK